MKGLETSTGKRLSTIVEEELPSARAAVWLGRLNWRYGAKEGGRFRDLVVPDLLAFTCAFGLPYGLEWVPGRWGILLGQLAAILLLVQSIKTLRLHYGLPWGKS